MFKALIFDLDNTLLDRPAAQWKWSEQFVDRWNSDERAADRQAAVEELFELDELGYVSREEFADRVLKRFPGWRPSEPHDDQKGTPAVRRAALLVEYRRELISFYPRHEDICSLIGRLQRTSTKLGVISNGRVSSQQPKMQQAGLDAAFESVVISEEVGFEKPHAAPFLASLRALDVAPGNAVYIGDNPRHDIGGAAEVGMKTCWVTLGRDFPDDLTAWPDLQIETVRDIESVL